MLLNRETEQQKMETNVTSDQMLSEYKALRRNSPKVRLTSGQKPWLTKVICRLRVDPFSKKNCDPELLKMLREATGQGQHF